MLSVLTLPHMQNLVDSLPQTFDSPVPEELHGALNTFVVYNRRRCVTSSAKRRRAPGSTMVSQTPDGSFLDLMRNARDLLSRCGLHHVPEVCEAPQSDAPPHAAHMLCTSTGEPFCYHAHAVIDASMLPCKACACVLRCHAAHRTSCSFTVSGRP